jgi:1-acyl-sn-glycerol-3-phosphate acyltransferase
MAVAPVANALGGVGRAAGVFPARTRSFSGLDGARRMLEAGQSVAIFPEGDVYSLARGSSSEARSGIAVLASEFDVPVVPSAGYGHQGRRVAGGARGASPVLRFGEPIRFRPAPAGAGDAERAAHVAEVAEVYAQAHDRLLQQAVASYRGA